MFKIYELNIYELNIHELNIHELNTIYELKVLRESFTDEGNFLVKIFVFVIIFKICTLSPKMDSSNRIAILWSKKRFFSKIFQTFHFPFKRIFRTKFRHS